MGSFYAPSSPTTRDVALEKRYIPNMVFTRRSIFVNEELVRPSDLPNWLGNDYCTTAFAPVEAVTVEAMENGDATFTVMYPFRAHTCAACRESFMTPQALVSHLEDRHPDDFIRFKCRLCLKSLPSLRGIAIHHGKCKKGQIRPADNTAALEHPFACGNCSESYATKIGLGQHIRHRHPEVANGKRIKAYREGILQKREARAALTQDRGTGPEQAEGGLRPTARSKIFSPEDDGLITELNARFMGERSINVKIAEFLPGRSAKQVGSRRACLGLLKPKHETVPKPIETVSAPVRVLPESVLDKGAFHEAVCLKGKGDLVSDSALILTSAADGEYDASAMDKLLSSLIAKCQSTIPRKGKSNAKGTGKKQGKPVGTKAKEAASRYHDHQYLFRQNRSGLATVILDQKELDTKCGLDPVDVESTYRARFGGESQPVNLDRYPIPQPVDNVKLCKPIKVGEVTRALARAKKDSAKGPDGIGLRTVIKCDPKGLFLTNMFNTWLCTAKIPSVVKENRSILLPKSSEGLEDINNWRPLTISSVLLRLYTSVIARRVLESFNLNERQRGFIAAPGCAENNYLLERVIEHAKKNSNPLCVAFLDLAKAFDTVSHLHLVAGLERFQADSHFIEVVKDLYHDASTVFVTARGKTGKIPMTRGVKQGDPLSPLLFNIAMDPLLAMITEQKNGYRFGDEVDDLIEALAYADDNALITDSPEEMSANLDLVDDFCQATGMRLNVKKSAAFYIKPAGKNTFSVNDFPEPLMVGGEEIPLIGPEGTTKYLGSKVSPWVTKVKKKVQGILADMLKNISKASLKPRQKLVMLLMHALPRLSYPLTMEKYSKGVLMDLDYMVRRHVRGWFKLPECSANAFLYTATTKGGLGLPEFVRSIPAGRMNLLNSITHSTDPKIRRMCEVMHTRAEIEMYAVKSGIAAPKGAKEKANWRKVAIKDWSKLSCAGKGRNYLSRREANSWLDPARDFLTEKEFITAAKLRTDTIPCRATLARAGRPSEALCRHCNLTIETVGHISGACPKVKGYRIKRHNIIVDTLANKCKDVGWVVCHEPHIRDDSGRNWKPDLVLTREGTAMVIDPTIVYETGRSLSIANAEKVRKYAHLVGQIKDRFGIETVTVRGLAIGCRGGWTAENSQTLRMLGIQDKGFSNHLARLALKGTINLIHLFMDI